MSLPPWARLKTHAKHVNVIDNSSSNVDWTEPPWLFLDKHFRFYRDLLKSTEKVELSLAHSGKTEVLDSFDDPTDPTEDPQVAVARVIPILVPLRFDQDPRDEFKQPDGRVGIRPEYKDPSYIQKLLLRRESGSIGIPSENPSPSPSPGSRMITESPPVGSDTPPARVTPPPPPTAPPNRPPPPKAPPPNRADDHNPSKKPRGLH